MRIKETRIKEYILPKKISAVSPNTERTEILCKKEILQQNYFGDTQYCEVKGTGYIIFDFGKEYFGGVRILLNCCSFAENLPNIRIRFGESLTECCCESGVNGAGNDHSTRDISVYMSSNSDMEWGSTGYRFVRIDFLQEGEYRLNGVYGTYIHRDESPKGCFECSDSRVNDIMRAAERTLRLNMQNRLWDGIKRDQHVWMGDLFPEILSILYLYGDHELICASLDDVVKQNPLPCWYNAIPSYSIWFVLCVNEYVRFCGKSADRYKSEIKQILRQFLSCIAEGELRFERAGLPVWDADFIEWPCVGTADAKIGVRYLLLYTVQKVVQDGCFDEEVYALCKKISEGLRGNKQKATVKSVVALGLLCGEEEKTRGVAELLRGGANGYSVFFSYFIAKALAENGETERALAALTEYYGGMLRLGATTFWEHFDLRWLENASPIDAFPKNGQRDVHRDYGAHCYQGFRKSLCHGWSCGVILFLFECVAGVRIKNGCYSVNPNLAGLERVFVRVPLSTGILQAESVCGERGVKTEKIPYRN